MQLPGDRAAAVYARSSGVLWVEPNRLRYPLALDPPNDPAYNNTDTNIGLDPTGATWFKWDSHLIQCVEGWSIWPGRYFTAADRSSAAVRIAIIDSGVDYSHPDFINTGGTSTGVADGGQLDRPLDRTILNGQVTPDAGDVYGHGTHVTGIAAAATNNGTGTTGNGYSATVLSLRVIDAAGNGNETDISQAIVYAADHGALICNISLGGYGYSQAEQDAVNYAWGKGTLVIAAAGNDGTNTSPNYPAALTRVLAVSATARTDVLATYSNYGDYIGIAAPGGDFDFDLDWFLGVYSTMPTYYVTLNDPNVAGAAQNYDYLMGTSMAAPETVGLAALYTGSKGYTQQTPGVTVKIWQALQRGADNVSGGDGSWDPDYGYGRISAFGTLNLDTNPNPRGATSGSVVGQVRYRDTPVPNAAVQMMPQAGGSPLSASSRADGGYRLAGAPPGAYNLTATVFGESQTIAGVEVVAGADTPGIDFNVGKQVIPPPPAPTSLTATAVSSSQINLAWKEAGSSATGFRIERKNAAGGFDDAGSVAGKSLAFSDAGLSGSTTYTYRVLATNDGGSSDPSNEASATTLPAVATLTLKPASVRGGSSAKGTVMLTGAVPKSVPSVTVALASDNAVARLVPARLIIRRGKISGTFAIPTKAVKVTTPVTISATLGVTEQATLTVRNR